MTSGGPLTVTETVLELIAIQVHVRSRGDDGNWTSAIYRGLLAGETTAALGASRILCTVYQINAASSSENNFHQKSLNKRSRIMTGIIARAFRHRTRLVFGDDRGAGRPGAHQELRAQPSGHAVSFGGAQTTVVRNARSSSSVTPRVSWPCRRRKSCRFLRTPRRWPHPFFSLKAIASAMRVPSDFVQVRRCVEGENTRGVRNAVTF